MNVASVASRLLLPLTAIVTLASVPVEAQAEPDGSPLEFAAVADASGYQMSYGIPGFVVVETFIDAGGPVSQAVLDTAGTPSSFASLPYPGPLAVGYKGLANIVLGSSPPTPEYPFFVSAAHPTQPEQAVGGPSDPYSLTATANTERVLGEARLGSPADAALKMGTGARSSVTVEGGKVVAEATSVVEGLSMEQLTVAAVRSRSITTYQPGDQEPSTTTELRVEGGKAGSFGFSYGPEGLTVTDQGVPIPGKDGLAAINQALAPTGTSVRFTEAAALTGGSQAAIFEVTNSADVPGAKKGTLRIRFGGARTSVEPRGVAAPETFSESIGGADAQGPEASSSEPAVAAIGGTPAPSPETAPSAASFEPNGPAGLTFAAPTALNVDGGRGAASAAVADAGVESATSAAPPEEPAAAALPSAAGTASPTLAAAPAAHDMAAPKQLAAVLLAGGVLAIGAVGGWAVRSRKGLA